MGLSPDVPGHGYVFTVNASDGVNTSMHNVFIRIDDVNERPEFTGTVETAICARRTRRDARRELSGAALRVPDDCVIHGAR